MDTNDPNLPPEEIVIEEQPVQPENTYKQDGVPPAQQEVYMTPTLKHSKLGIMAFVISLLMPIIMLTLTAIFAIMTYGLFTTDMLNLNSIANQNEVLETMIEKPQLKFIILGIFTASMGIFVGFILSIVSLFQKNTKKLFGVLALAISLIPLVIVGIIVFAVIGGLFNFI